MIKYIFAAVVFMMGTISAKATDIYVLDKKTGQPVVSANIHLTSLEGRHKDSVVVKRTDINGYAKNTFKVRTALLITNVVYNPYIDTLDADTKEIECGLEPKNIVTETIVTTGQYIPQSSQESVYPVSVISQARIKAKAAPTLRDLMSTEANIRLSQDNILGSSMSINGISGQNIKILIDGVPVIGRLNGNVDISQISMNNVEKVEIIEGPMSAIYGTDALGGVINIISEDPVCDRIEGTVNGYYESVGQYNFDGTLRYNFGKNKLLFNAGRNFFSGYSQTDTSRHKQWKPKEQYFADLIYSRRFGGLRLKYSGKYFHEFILNRGLPRLPYRETAFDDNYVTDRFSNALFLDGKVEDGRFINLTAGYSLYRRKKNTFFKDLVTLDERLSSEPGAQDTTNFTNWLLRGTYSSDNIASNLGYQLGFDINLDNVAGARIENEGRSIGDYAAFLSFKYEPWSSFVVQPAGRFIYNTKYEAPVIPSLNLKYAVTDMLTLRASYARGFRAPTVRELYFLFVDVNHNIRGNEDLGAESSHSVNAALNIQFESDRKVIKLEPAIFFNNISELITLALVEGDLYSYVNIGDYKTLGGKLSFSYFLSNMNFRLTGSYIGRSNRLEDLEVDNYSYSPELQANINYLLPWNTELSLFYKYTGELPGFTVREVDGVDTLFEYVKEDYHMMDISLIKKFFDNKIALTAGVKNLFDVNNIEQTSTVSEGVHSGGENGMPISWGRTVFTRLSINL
ncbi:MAG: TonB-dependent receptor plug domain-containing protein [Candidatus Kapaibacterium sp.]